MSNKLKSYMGPLLLKGSLDFIQNIYEGSKKMGLSKKQVSGVK